MLSDDKMILAHSGDCYDQFLGSIAPPIFLSSLFRCKNLEEYGFSTPGKHIYSRYSNPDVSILEQKVAETKTAYEDLYARYGTSTNREEYYLWQNANLKMLGAEDQLGYIRMQKNGTKIELLDDENPCEIQVFRLGGTCVIGVQGEVFVEYALYLKAVAGFGTVIFNELSNGVLPGYLYTPESLVTGGYETDTSMLAESFGRHMVEKALETIQQVK